MRRVSIVSLALASLVALVALLPSRTEAQRVDPGGAPPAGSGDVEVTGFVRVVDGDTIETRINGQRVGIGLLGIEAPMGNTPCGETATAKLETLVRGGLHLEEDPSATFYGRGPRMYHVKQRDGRSVAEEMADSGLARTTGQGKDRQALEAAEASAKAARKGCLWGGRQAQGSPSELVALAPSGAGAVSDGGIVALADAGARVQAAPASATVLPNGFTQDVIATVNYAPTSFDFLPDGRILIAQKQGVIYVVKHGQLVSTPFLNIISRVNNYWDHGLLGIAVDPNYAQTGYVYLYYVYENDAAQVDGPKIARVTRVKTDSSNGQWLDTASPSSEEVILGKQPVYATATSSSCTPVTTDCIPGDSASHNGGGLHFDADGNLWVSLGEASNFNFVDTNSLRAQNLDSLAGKLLRINPNTGNGVAGNPYYSASAPGANRSKIWAYGLRNPFRVTTRPGGIVPYVGDVGWSTWEEISTVPTGGANLGWPCYEGTARQSGFANEQTCKDLYDATDSKVRMPLTQYATAPGGASVMGGAFYTGAGYPAEYQGAYFFADYTRNFIRYLKVGPNHGLTAGPTDFATAADAPTQLRIGPDGDLYYLSLSTLQLRRVRYPAGDPGPTPTPSPTSTSGNTAPTATITAPSSTYKFKVGDVVSFTGSATDAQDGTIPSSGLSWAVVLQHCFDGTCHAHPFLSGITGPSGSFTVPDHGDGSYFEITLTATDSGGLTGSSMVTLHGQTVDVSIASSPPGLELVYDGKTAVAPFTRTSIVGSTHSLYAPSPQGGPEFQSWSDGGTQSHNVQVNAATTFTATFAPPAVAPGPFLEQGGQVVMAAEHAHASITRSDKTWTWRTDQAGSVSGGAMVALPNNFGMIDANYATTSAELQYRARFATAGTYYVWLRVWAPSGSDDSVHVGLDGAAPASAARITAPAWGSWVWMNATTAGAPATLTVPAGDHVVSLWMREDGVYVDRLLLTTGATPPSGAGPAESPRADSGAPSPTPTSTPTPTPTTSTAAFQETGGQVVMAAEHAHASITRSDKTWTWRTDQAGFVSGGAMVALPNNFGMIDADYATTSAELQYQVRFATAGTYYVWLRVYAPGGSDDSVHVGLDGAAPASAARITAPAWGSWVWMNATTAGAPATLAVPAGDHVVSLWMREDGVYVDRLLLTTGATPPSGDGPAESPRAADSGTPTSTSTSTPTPTLTPTVTLTPTSTSTPAPVTGPFQEAGGQIVVEAEHLHEVTSQGGRSWSAKTDQAGYVGDAAMWVGPDTGGQIDGNYATRSPEMRYRVNVGTAGTYYVWLRVWAPDLNGDSVHVGLDGASVSGAAKITAPALRQWTWMRQTTGNSPASLSIPAGQHVVNVWMREDGIRVDRLLLTTNASFTPTGTGPAESPRAP